MTQANAPAVKDAHGADPAADRGRRQLGAGNIGEAWS
jgi:hypothetical protein